MFLGTSFSRLLLQIWSNENMSIIKVKEDDLRQLFIKKYVLSMMDFAIIRWRNNRVSKLSTKIKSELVNHVHLPKRSARGMTNNLSAQ